MVKFIESAIETGFRISGTPKDIKEYWQIARTFRSRHVQIDSVRPDEIREVAGAARDEFGANLELSYYLDNPSGIEDILKHWNQYLQLSQDFSAKFLIIPDTTWQNQEAPKYLHRDLVESLLKGADERNKFLCLEMSPEVGTKSKAKTPAQLANLKGEHPSHFLMFSIKLDGLDSVSFIEPYTQLIRLEIATVHLHVREDFVRDSGAKYKFLGLIDHLYWLPFKQQPLVFTNPLDSLGEVYEQFFAIVKENGYQYI